MARWRRGVAALVVAVVASVGLAVPAFALDCKGDAPAPQTPTEAAGANFDKGPENPTVGDPWADPATSTIYETYGYAGLMWTTYDLGCFADAARSPAAVAGTWVANSIASLYIGAVAIDAALSRLVFSPDRWLGPVDGAFERLAAALREPVVLVMALAVFALALSMAWKADQSQYADTASRVMRLFAVAAVFALLYGAPATLARAFDSSLAWGVDTAQRAFTGTATETSEGDYGTGLTANIHESILYETWLAGAFGNSGSEVATKYGPRIFDATARTYAEQARAEDDPEYAKTLDAEKAAEYKAVAAEVQAISPEAYANLIGQRSHNRIYSALAGGASATITVTFSIVAKAIAAQGFVVMRVGVMLGFVLVAVAVLRPDKAIAFAEAVGRILLNGLWFGIAVGGFAVFQMALIRSDVPTWAAAALTLITAVVFWRLTKALRANDPTGTVARAKRFATDQGINYASRRWAARSALASQARADRDDDEEPDETTTEGSAASPYSFVTTLAPEIERVDEPVALPPPVEPIVAEPAPARWELEPAPSTATPAPPEVPATRSDPVDEPEVVGPDVADPVPALVEAPVEDIDGQSVYRLYVPEDEP